MELPFFVVKRADDPRLEPPRDAVEVEGVVADSPGSGALLICIANGVSLAVNAGLHNVVLADGAVVDVDVYNKEGCEQIVRGKPLPSL